jgi:hypothetical protein
MPESGSLSAFILHQVIPVTGVLSYEAFAVFFFNDSVITLIFTPTTSQTLISCLNYNSNLAAAIYLYYRPHIQALPATKRVIYSAFGSISFNFSSFFFWIMTRDLVKDDWRRSIFALMTASTLVLIAGSYVHHIDMQFERNKGE